MITLVMQDDTDSANKKMFSQEKRKQKWGQSKITYCRMPRDLNTLSSQSKVAFTLLDFLCVNLVNLKLFLFIYNNSFVRLRSFLCYFMLVSVMRMWKKCSLDLDTFQFMYYRQTNI